MFSPLQHSCCKKENTHTHTQQQQKRGVKGPAGEMAQQIRADSQHPHSGSGPSITLVPGDPISFSDPLFWLARAHGADINAGKTHIHIKT